MVFGAVLKCRATRLLVPIFTKSRHFKILKSTRTFPFPVSFYNKNIRNCECENQVQQEGQGQGKEMEVEGNDGEPSISAQNKGADVDNTELSHSNTKPHNKSETTLSKRAQKRIARSQHYKELQKKRKAERLKQVTNDDAGYRVEHFDQSSYYFENGLRKVYPYNYVFSTFAKGRWIGKNLYDILAKEFGYDTPDELTNAFKLGRILVNNVKVGPEYTIKDCDYISHSTHRHENCVSAAPLDVLHDTEDLVVINKPSSIPCHPCGRYRFNSIVFILGKEMGYTNLRNIYRLDRLTSGVLILGKSAQRTKLLEDQIANRQVQKEYVCRVVGKFPDGQVEVNQPLQALSNKLRLQVVSPSGKPSRTCFERISYNGTSSLVKCWPHTGRTHQIRVHLQYLGHPILNDGFYNSPAWGPNKAKGGLYEVPHQEVCERILKEHHVTLWDGGENPLYLDKLRAHQVSENVSESNPKETKAEDNRKTVDEASENLSEPALKKPKTEDNRKTDNKVSENLSEPAPKESKSEDNGKTQSELTTATSSEPASKKCKTENDGGAESKNSVELELEVSASVDEQDKNLPPSCHSDKSDTAVSLSDWDRIDLDCELCKRKPLDPGAKHLIMFLHALKYKGPDWEFEAPLPEWAQETWRQEDDYTL